MSSRSRNPQWWQLYVGLPLLVGLFWPEMQLRLPETENVMAQLGILFLIFGFVQLWLHANRSALMNLDEDEGQRGRRVYEIPPASLRASDDLERRTREHPMLKIPSSGVKGVLSDTFEWDSSEEESRASVKQSIRSRKE